MVLVSWRAVDDSDKKFERLLRHNPINHIGRQELLSDDSFTRFQGTR